jgi:ABC-type transport system involved in multi-copper enzyme maturation permease subunit
MRAVLERDFLFEASRPRAVVARTLLGAVVATVVVIVLWQGSHEFTSNPDRIGRAVFQGGSLTLLVLLALITPPLVVGSVLAERQQETLPLVLATPVGPCAFAAAKLLSRAGLAFTMALAALPCLGLPILFGGVTGGQVADLAVTAAAVVLETAAWALWMSTVSRRLATAVVLSFLIPLARWVGMAIFFAWISERGFNPEKPRDLWILLGCLASPLGALLEMVEPGIVGGVRRVPAEQVLPDFLFSHPAVVFLAVAALLAAMAVLASGSRLRTESEPRSDWFARSRKARRWMRRGLPAGNPVLWKEARLLNTAGSRPLYYGVFVLMVLVELPGLLATVDSGEVTIGIFATHATLLALVAAVAGAATIGHEKTQGGYDLLRASPLTPTQIARGKMFGILLGLALLAVIPVAHLLLAACFGTIRVPTLLAGLCVLSLLPAFWAQVGLDYGFRCPRVRGAVVRTLAAFAVLIAGFPLAGYLVSTMVSGWHGDRLFSAIATVSPPAMAYQLLGWVEGADPDPWRRESPDIAARIVFAAVAVLAVVRVRTLPRHLARRLDGERDTG